MDKLPRSSAWLSIAAFCCAGVAALVTLFWPGSFPAPPDSSVANTVWAEARGWSAVTLALAAPFFAWALRGARNGSLRSTLCWLGALFYLFYTELELAVSPPFTPLYLLYIASFALALWSLVLGAAELDLDRLAESFGARVPRRTIIAYCFTFAIGLSLAWLKMIVEESAAGRFGWPSGVAAVGHVVHALDLGLVCSLGVAAGVLMLRRARLALLVAGITLVFASLMSTALAAMVAVSVHASSQSWLAVTPFVVLAAASITIALRFLGAMELDYPRGTALSGRTFVVTGATSGIGREVARQLAAQHASLVIVSRDAARGEAMRRELSRWTQTVDLVVGDLSRQSEVRRVAREIEALAPHIDALINNAGVSPRDRRTTEDGVELGLAVNVLAPFLLSELLRDRLVASAPARIVNVAGMYHKKATLDLADLDSNHRFDAMTSGNRAKLFLVMSTLESARRLAGTGVTSNCLHPGIARTGIQRELPWYLRLLARTILRPVFGSPRGPAANVVHLATAPELADVSGAYFHERRRDAPSPLATDRELVRAAWVWCEAHTRPTVGASGRRQIEVAERDARDFISAAIPAA